MSRHVEYKRAASRQRLKRRIGRGVLYASLIALALAQLVPFFWMASTSIKTSEEAAMMSELVPKDLSAEAIGEAARYWLPKRPQWANYVKVLGLDPERTRLRVNFAYACINSVFIALAITFGQVLTSAMAGFAFARLRWPGRDAAFLLYIATLMIPGTVTMIPGFLVLRAFDWIDTYQALIIPGLCSAFGTFLVRQYMLGLSSELEESAMIDGASHLGIFLHVALPLSRPVLVALAILNFLGAWQGFLGPLIVTYSEKLRVAPVALYMIQSQYASEANLVMAGALLLMIPSIIIFVLGQRFFVEGIQLGAVKG
jgi:multiple sugar transport system permease protein